MGKIKELYTENRDFIMEVIHFGMVGVINTFMGWVFMAVMYNLIHVNYWLSSAISYFIGSVFSYYANGKLTFKVENKDKWLPWRFAANIIVCYLVAFCGARPLMRHLLSSQPVVVVDNVAMVVGIFFFIVMNFFGQKLFVFRTGKRINGEKDGTTD